MAKKDEMLATKDRYMAMAADPEKLLREQYDSRKSELKEKMDSKMHEL